MLALLLLRIFSIYSIIIFLFNNYNKMYVNIQNCFSLNIILQIYKGFFSK